jgi:hypothetical protein
MHYSNGIGMNENEHNKTVVITENELTWLVAALLLIIVFSFVAGFYYGKWRAAADVVDRIERESFADRVYCALTGVHGVPADPVESDTPSCFDDEAVDARTCGDSDEPKTEEEHYSANTASDDTISGDTPGPSDHEQAKRYKARLVGFGTKKAANAYYNTLAKRGVTADIDERVSATKRGKRVTWFQVVCTDTKDAIEDIVERLKKDDKLTNVQIVQI